MTAELSYLYDLFFDLCFHHEKFIYKEKKAITFILIIFPFFKSLSKSFLHITLNYLSEKKNIIKDKNKKTLFKPDMFFFFGNKFPSMPACLYMNRVVDFFLLKKLYEINIEKFWMKSFLY